MYSSNNQDRLEDSQADDSTMNDSRLNDSVAGPRQRKKKSLKDFEFVINQKSRYPTSELGKGAYGTVKKARDLENGKICAMKIMNKKAIFEYSNKDNLRREINIQKKISHPHIIKLYTYFEDSENVYLILEFAENGSLFQYLRNKKKLSEKEAFIFFFQTCLGIDYLHKKNVIHRDLKPENLLIDAEGNIKLCDFGWSVDTQGHRHTFCGTVDYMAPEMIKNQPHDYRIDIWCLGVLLYEMLHGHAPFKGKSEREKIKNISANSAITFDESLSPEAIDLIKKILRPAPINRISLSEIFQHPWLKMHESVFDIDIMTYVSQQDEHIQHLQRMESQKTNNKESQQSKPQRSQQPINDENYQPRPASPSSRMKNVRPTPAPLNPLNQNMFHQERYNRIGDELNMNKNRPYSDSNYNERPVKERDMQDRSERLETHQSGWTQAMPVDTPQFVDSKKKSVTADPYLRQDSPNLVQRIDYKRECSFGTEENQVDSWNSNKTADRIDTYSFQQSFGDENMEDILQKMRSQKVQSDSTLERSHPPYRQPSQVLSYSNPFRTSSESLFQRNASKKVTGSFGNKSSTYQEMPWTSKYQAVSTIHEEEEHRTQWRQERSRRKKFEIEDDRKESEERRPQKELGFFERMLARIGCIDRSESKSPGGKPKNKKQKKKSTFCLS